MRNLSKIFSVFLVVSLIMAVSFCCCIKEALAKQTHSCCHKSSSKESQPCHTKEHICPKLVSSFGDQTIDTVKVNLQSFTVDYSAVQIAAVAQVEHSTQSFVHSPPGSASKTPLYISFHNFRI